MSEEKKEMHVEDKKKEEPRQYTEEEQKIINKYGKLPKSSELIRGRHRAKQNFDSADWELSKQKKPGTNQNSSLQQITAKKLLQSKQSEI